MGNQYYFNPFGRKLCNSRRVEKVQKLVDPKLSNIPKESRAGAAILLDGTEFQALMASISPRVVYRSDKVIHCQHPDAGSNVIVVIKRGR